MKSISATAAKDRLGAFIDAARVEPIAIERTGRPVAVILSWEEYRRLEALEVACWAQRAGSGGGRVPRTGGIRGFPAHQVECAGLTCRGGLGIS